MKKLFVPLFISFLLLSSSSFALVDSESATPQFFFNQVGTSGKQPVKIEVAPGSSFTIDFAVANMDSARGISVELEVVDYNSTPESKSFKPEWVTFEPAVVNLKANEIVNIQATVVMSETLEEGLYDSIFQARLVDFDGSNREGAAVAVNVAVGLKSYITLSNDAQKVGELVSYADLIADVPQKPAIDFNSWLQHNLIYILGAVIILLLVKMIMRKKK